MGKLGTLGVDQPVCLSMLLSSELSMWQALGTESPGQIFTGLVQIILPSVQCQHFDFEFIQLID